MAARLFEPLADGIGHACSACGEVVIAEQVGGLENHICQRTNPMEYAAIPAPPGYPYFRRRPVTMYRDGDEIVLDERRYSHDSDATHFRVHHPHSTRHLLAVWNEGARRYVNLGEIRLLFERYRILADFDNECITKHPVDPYLADLAFDTLEEAAAFMVDEYRWHRLLAVERNARIAEAHRRIHWRTLMTPLDRERAITYANRTAKWSPLCAFDQECNP